jgi:RNA polymerase sigma factor (sigma-70 family)
MGIFTANKSYEADKGSWAQYSSYFIKNEIRSLLGRPGPFVESLDEPMPGTDDLTLMDTISDETQPDTDAGLLMDERRQTVRAAVDRLPDQQRNYVKLRYLEGLGQHQTAEALNIDLVKLRNVWDCARRRLRRDQTLRELSYFHVSASSFSRTHTSAVEYAILLMERMGYEISKRPKDFEASAG